MIFDIKETSDKNFIAVRYTNSFGVKKDNIYVIKADFDGNLLWEKLIGPKKFPAWEAHINTWGEDINQTLFSEVCSIIKIKETLAIEKYSYTNEKGEQVEKRAELHIEAIIKFIDNFPVRGKSIMEENDGSFIIVGNGLSDQDRYVYSPANSIFLVKIDKNGNILRKKNLCFNGIDEDINSFIKKENNYLIFGSSYHWDVENSSARKPYYVIIDSNWKFIKERYFLPYIGEGGDDDHISGEIKCVQRTLDSGYIVLIKEGDWHGRNFRFFIEKVFNKNFGNISEKEVKDFLKNTLMKK